MALPSSQHYRAKGRQLGINPTTLDRAVEVIERIRRSDPRIAPVLTLRHLSELTETPYGYLRRTVGRVINNYRHISLKKRIPGRSRRRIISIPSKQLLHVQQWIAQNILQYTLPSSASFAYHPDSSAVHAAQEHCHCKWLLKIDIEDFFHSVTESRVSDVFFRLGFSRLVAFEFARLTTVLLEKSLKLQRSQNRWATIPYYQSEYEGVLPQGAPTSPMLSNLIMRDLDERLINLSTQHGMRFTRYADDLAFSCTDRDRVDIERFKRLVLKELSHEGFSHNRRKTVVRGPGTRRIVLGMLVDGPTPRLPREFKDMIRLHLHYLNSTRFGPSKHAIERQASVSGLYHHVRGLIGWAVSVEPEFGKRALERFHAVEWPPVQPRWANFLKE